MDFSSILAGLSVGNAISVLILAATLYASIRFAIDIVEYVAGFFDGSNARRDAARARLERMRNRG